MSRVKALVLTGYGLNCDYETDFALRKAGAQSHRAHINELVRGSRNRRGQGLEDFHLLVFGGGFSWADDHGAGVLMASKLRRHLGAEMEKFIDDGKLILGICNGFQTLVNLGFLPGFDRRYHERRLAVTYNDSGNFIDAWVNLKVDPQSPCVFTGGLSGLELPVRHGEGKVYAAAEDIDRLLTERQAALIYADESGEPAKGRWPLNPNGSLADIAGVCDPTGRIFGLMPHPEAFNHFTNHPDWTSKKAALRREGKQVSNTAGDGIKIFQNAVDYIRSAFPLA
jgi:phosphoribosylformylglycinamidine synthase